MRRLLWNFSAAWLLVACAGSAENWLRWRTVGRVGCPEREIVILDKDVNVGRGSTTWTARCRGREYFCVLENDNTTCTPGAREWGEL